MFDVVLCGQIHPIFALDVALMRQLAPELIKELHKLELPKSLAMLLHHFQPFERFVIAKSVLIFVQRSAQDVCRGIKKGENVLKSLLAVL